MTTFSVLRLISFLISLSAVIFGITKVLTKKAPMYFKLVVGAAVCYMLKELSRQTAYICGNPQGNTVVEILAVIGTVFFLLSAEYGQIDGLVDDSSTKKGIKFASCIIPIILIFSYAVMLAMGLSNNLPKAIAYGLTVLIMLPASYYNTKHLLMKEDEVGFLISSKLCNIFALLYWLGTDVIMIAGIGDNRIFSDVIHTLVSCISLALVLSAEWGVKKWKILISSFL